jgi:hypothetical protein
MANPTTNFGWQMPTATDLVTDLPADFEVFGQAVDTDFVDLLGGTTGQVLSKASGTDLDFTWIEQDDTTLSFNAQTGTTYTLVLADSAKLVTTSNASAITVTIPPSIFAAGNQINLQSIGAGLTTYRRRSRCNYYLNRSNGRPLLFFEHSIRLAQLSVPLQMSLRSLAI